MTQEQWEKVMKNNPSEFHGAKIANYVKYRYKDRQLELPVENINWADCNKYCKQVGLRLPTEAEWEYACRGGTTSTYIWGNKWDHTNQNVVFSINTV